MGHPKLSLIHTLMQKLQVFIVQMKPDFFNASL